MHLNDNITLGEPRQPLHQAQKHRKGIGTDGILANVVNYRFAKMVEMNIQDALSYLSAAALKVCVFEYGSVASSLPGSASGISTAQIVQGLACHWQKR